MRPAFVLLAGLALGGGPVAAETWVPLGGPPGGDVRALAADPRDPRVLYLGTTQGVLYRSDDAGLLWRRLEPGFPQRGMSLDEIVVGPDGTLFVGYWEVSGRGGGVARSADGGRTFAVLPGIAGESVRALAQAPSDARVLVAGSLTGAFRSEDGGDTWRRISPEGHPDLRNIESLALDPGSATVVYAGTWHLPWKSLDAGKTWRPARAGMIDDSDVFTLTLDRRDPRTVYATACSGIYRSGDGASRWAKMRGIPASSRRTRAFAQDPERPDTLYAGTTEGLWMSEDGGLAWRLATSKDLVVNAVLPLGGGALLLGSDGAGVLRSADRGRTWSASNDGFAERFVARLVFGAPGRRVLAAIAGDRFHGGVLAAPRSGGPWTKVGQGLEGREVLAVATAGGGALAGTDDGVFLSVSPTGTWRRLHIVVDGMDVHPRAADVLALEGSTFLAATSRGLLRSADAGETWERRTLGLAAAVSALAAAGDGRTVLAATPLGVFRSRDAGATWAQVSQGFADGLVHALIVLPADEHVVFATTSRGLYKSVDQGASWYKRGGGLPLSDITGLAAHPDGRTLVASDFTLGGMYRSDDGGETWARFTTEGLLTDRVWAVAVEPGASPRWLVASPTGGLHALVPRAAQELVASP